MSNRALKPSLATALIVNIAGLIYLMVIFLVHRSAAQQLPNSNKFELIEKALRAQSADDGRNNAIELLSKSSASLSATINLVHRGFYYTAGLLLANILLSGACLHRLIKYRQ